MDSGFRGYLETKDQEQKAGSRHVEADGDEAGKRGEQVEEEGLVQALQEVVELAEHALQGPARVGWRHGQPGLQAPLPHSIPSMEGGVGSHLLAHCHQVILILSEAVNAADGQGLHTVAQEEAVRAMGAARSLLQDHEQQGLQGLQRPVY